MNHYNTGINETGRDMRMERFIRRIFMNGKQKNFPLIKLVYIINFFLLSCTLIAEPDINTVSFRNITADGSTTSTTTHLTLTFSNPGITDLTTENITLSGVSGVTKGTLSGSGTSYILDINGFTSSGTVAIALSKPGYVIYNSSRTVAIHYAGSGSDAGPVFSRDLLNEMYLHTHEGTPAGVPDYCDWKFRPRLRLGLNVPDGWNAILAWGQVYADETQPSPDKDFPLARVHIKDLQLYIYQKDKTWKLVQNIQNPSGALYIESYANNINKPADIRNESGGGISIQAGSGFTFHFYPNSKSTFDPNNIKGVLVLCKARLIGTQSYRALPKYLMNVGGDYWSSANTQWQSQFADNDDIGIGRFKYVTTNWQYFIMHTFSKEELNNVVFPLE